MSQVSLHFIPGGLSHLPPSRIALHLSSDISSLHSPSPLSGPPSSSHASQVLGHFLVIFGSSHWSFHLLHFGDLSLHLPSPPSRIALHLSSDISSLHSPSPLSGPPSSLHM